MNKKNKIRSDRYLINWHDTDFKGLATPVTICNYLSESAGRQAESLGFGYEDAIRLGQFWVVLRWFIKMDKYPKWKEEIIIETWPRMPEHLYAYRDYYIKTPDGEVLGTATSTWMVLDGQSRRPKKLELVEGLLHHTLDKKALDENASKVIIPKEFDNVGNIKPQYTDMDFNGHVINSKYVSWCLDLFGDKFHKAHSLAELQINFLHECRFGDEMELRMSKVAEQQFVVVAVNIKTGKNIFAAELLWQIL